MFRKLKFIDTEGSMIRAERDDSTIVIIEREMTELWKSVNSGKFGKIENFRPLPAPTEKDKTRKRREEMFSEAYKFKIAMHRMGHLVEVTEITETDSELSLIFQNATTFNRLGSLCLALSEAGIDDGVLDDAFDLDLQAT